MFLKLVYNLLPSSARVPGVGHVEQAERVLALVGARRDTISEDSARTAECRYRKPPLLTAGAERLRPTANQCVTLQTRRTSASVIEMHHMDGPGDARARLMLIPSD